MGRRWLVMVSAILATACGQMSLNGEAPRVVLGSLSVFPTSLVAEGGNLNCNIFTIKNVSSLTSGVIQIRSLSPYIVVPTAAEENTCYQVARLSPGEECQYRPQAAWGGPELTPPFGMIEISEISAHYGQVQTRKIYVRVNIGTPTLTTVLSCGLPLAPGPQSTQSTGPSAP